MRVSQGGSRRRSFSFDELLNTVAMWALAFLWALPLLYAIWTAFHPAAFETRFELTGWCAAHGPAQTAREPS